MLQECPSNPNPKKKAGPDSDAFTKIILKYIETPA